ncbi:MAG: undecaprenyl-diphosphate phosphatase [Oscillospiraceae bacterium]|nr:undecaprenyl-diphosphate phosphatase [Oscillospiraceae bacterium]
MSYAEAFLQAVLQGLTEFLPVSSSGHLSLFQHFTGNSGETGVFFSLMLHLGTLIAVFIAFRDTILQLIVEFFAMAAEICTGKFSWKERTPYRNMVVMILLGCVPMAFTLVLKDFYTGFSADDNIFWEGVFFLITAVLMYLADHCVKGGKGPGGISSRTALTIGAAQAVLAPLPGVSRSGSTISAGLLSGLDRETAVQFSFILGIPAILGGSLSEILDVTSADLAAAGMGQILLGIAVSAVVGLLAIKMVDYIVRTDKFKYFVWYTALLGIIVIAVGIFESIAGMNIVTYFAG